MTKITEFIDQHHLLSISTCRGDFPHSASCFYAFDSKEFVFVIASNSSTKHIQDLKSNPNYAATIALETTDVGKIRGLQFSGVLKKTTTTQKALYIKTFPYALALNPTLWALHVEHLKFTDNRLGFGKKLVFKRGKDGANFAPSF